MSTRICAGVGEHPCFFTDFKITNFSLYLFVCLFITSIYCFKKKNDDKMLLLSAHSIIN